MLMSFISTLTMGYGTRRPVGLRIRWCGKYDERQGIACTSRGANFAVRRSPLQRYHRS